MIHTCQLTPDPGVHQASPADRSRSSNSPHKYANVAFFAENNEDAEHQQCHRPIMLIVFPPTPLIDHPAAALHKQVCPPVLLVLLLPLLVSPSALSLSRCFWPSGSNVSRLLLLEGCCDNNSSSRMIVVVLLARIDEAMVFVGKRSHFRRTLNRPESRTLSICHRKADAKRRTDGNNSVYNASSRD